ncbi:hypothetical protein [Streptomyces griseorubiginosus]|uniref:hypothetical protein n=1 Tax=Streptomyces griseorubiginosus TaxID=67304 RepID=UPI00365552F9
MVVLLLVLIAALFAVGFLHSIWWVAAAVLVYAVAHHGRDRGGGRSHSGGSDPVDYRDYRDYRDRRDRQDRWDRRYSRQNRARWKRQDRRDHEHRR